MAHAKWQRQRPALLLARLQAAYRKRKAQQPGLCEHCGQVMAGDGRSCSDRCFYHGHDRCVPFDRLDSAAIDEVLIPIYPRAVYSAGEALARMALRRSGQGRAAMIDTIPAIAGTFDWGSPLAGFVGDIANGHSDKRFCVK